MEKIEKKELTKKEKTMHEHRISLWLDKYTDIFSDFDPRPFSERSLSQDFLEEAERASRDKASGKIELRLLMPEKQRKHNQEGIIKKRLRESFKKHHGDFSKRKRRTIQRGIFFIIAGIVLMFIATYILFEYESTLFTTFMVVFLEPAGWFFFWEGLAQIIFESKKFNRKLNFYRKMSRCDINFYSYS